MPIKRESTSLILSKRKGDKGSHYMMLGGPKIYHYFWKNMFLIGPSPKWTLKTWFRPKPWLGALLLGLYPTPLRARAACLSLGTRTTPDVPRFRHWACTQRSVGLGSILEPRCWTHVKHSFSIGVKPKPRCKACTQCHISSSATFEP